MTAVIIKIISVLILTVTAIVGILFEFKDKQGRLSKWGIITLIITIIAGVTGISTELLEYRKEIVQEKNEKIQEAEHKKSLTEIRNEIVTGNYPLTPFRLFYTLRHTETEKTIDKYFKGIDGYRSIKESDPLQLVASIVISEIPFNSEQIEPKLSHCIVKGEKIEEMRKDEDKEDTPVLTHFNCIIEIFNNPKSEIPDIVLESSFPACHRPKTVREIRLYDNWLYQDTYIIDWSYHISKERVHGLQDLKSARLKLKMQFNVDDKISLHYPPSFTNLYLLFGSDPTYLLYFSEEQLKKQKVIKGNLLDGPNMILDSLSKEIFVSQTIEFEMLITDSIFQKQILQMSH